MSSVWKQFVTCYLKAIELQGVLIGLAWLLGNATDVLEFGIYFAGRRTDQAGQRPSLSWLWPHGAPSKDPDEETFLCTLLVLVRDQIAFRHPRYPGRAGVP